MSFWYLASPYSRYRDGLDAAFRLAARNAGILLRASVPVFSPIAHSHPIAVESSLDPLDHTIWLPFDEPMMNAAQGIIVLMAQGWRESYGVKEEIKHFHAANKPIIYMMPGQVPFEFAHLRHEDHPDAD